LSDHSGFIDSMLHFYFLTFSNQYLNCDSSVVLAQDAAETSNAEGRNTMFLPTRAA